MDEATIREFNDLFDSGLSESQIKEYARLFKKMTPQEIEDERSRQVKCHYASLIQYEIQKLTEDQLFKILVLIKNTTDGLTEVAPQRAPKPSRNRALFDGSKRMSIDDAYINIRGAGNALKKILNEDKLNEGYGILSLFGESTTSNVFVSEYICFCIPDKIDMMAEVAPHPSGANGSIVYILSTAIVGEEGRNVKTLYTFDTLVEEIRNIVKQYKKVK